MAFSIKPSKSFGGEFARVAEAQLRLAIDSLEKRPEGTHEAIHAARKRFKRLRALYRLVEPDARSFRERENERIRNMARTLSAVRDATALVETLDYLKSASSGEEEMEALQEAQERLRNRRDEIAQEAEADLEARLQAAVETCQEAIQALDHLDLPEGRTRTAKRLEKVWRKQLGKAHRALEECRTSHTEEAFHELRKCGQVYWMHLQLLYDLWPSAIEAKREQVKHLVDLLGHEHDLSVLVQTINETPDLLPKSETLALLLGAVIRNQQALRSEVLSRAQQIFIDRPSNEAAIVATLWLEAAD
ncbi:CHAD domain-containing protein [Rhizobium helianthi]|uniref:CHAD domain-containing protein n=1 Tax=Rhizobium helianthi TaxID=1132695 RepID=A0ABW4M6N4_9HYPH